MLARSRPALRILTPRFASSMADVEPSAADAAAPPAADPLVQFVVVRRDLKEGEVPWPAGAVMAQAVHAASAALWKWRAEPETVRFCEEEGGAQMHVVTKAAKNEGQLRKAAAALDAAGVGNCLWVEQPEGVATALAVRPMPSSVVAPVLRKWQLFK